MSDFHLARDMVYVEEYGAATGTSAVTTVTSGSADAFGSWVEAIASTAEDCNLMFIQFSSSGVSEIAVNIGVGAAASEQIVINALSTQIKVDRATPKFWVPINMPAGSRIAVQTAADSASLAVSFQLAIYKASFLSPPSYASSMSFGMDGTAISQGTIVDPGGTAHTKSAWVELDASTSDAVGEFWVTIGTDDNAAQANASWLFDLAIGAASSEEIIVENMWVTGSSQEITKGPFYCPIAIPSGTRIAARAQCSITDATDRVLTFSLHGMVM